MAIEITYTGVGEQEEESEGCETSGGMKKGETRDEGVNVVEWKEYR